MADRVREGALSVCNVRPVGRGPVMPKCNTGATPTACRPESSRPRLSLRHLWGVALRSLARGFARSRLELAAKTALAAGLAWAVAPLMPGPAAEHPYYAPLGVLVSMHPTVAGSVRNGLQSLLGLALGIGVAIAVASFTETSSLAVAAVVGLGILVGGLPGKPTAADWVPLAALFVLVIGGHSPDDFSFAYMLQMAVGVGIGFAVNWLVLPPLHFRGIAAASARHVDALARQLDEMAAALVEPWPPDHEEWASRDGQLAQTASGVREAVHEAEESATANPRRRRHPRDLGQDVRDLRFLERMTFQVQDITDVLASVIWEEHAGTTVPLELTGELEAALASPAPLVRGWEHDDVGDRLERAQAAVDALSAALRAAASQDSSVNATASMAMSLRRMIGTVRRRATDAGS